jgi:pyruvate dehydrogenase E2 component (dihydrolipoamide acetyltransferase)
VSIAVAVQTEEGLVAPVIRDPASRSIGEVADAIRDLAGRAEARTLTADDYEGGTFTVTNLGAYGVEGFTPIINLPQVAILGVGALRLLPALEEDGSVGAHHQMVLSLTFDHAVVDGAPAAAFLNDLRRVLVN